MRSKLRKTWIWARENGAEFYCERCGATSRPPLPMEVKAYVAFGRAFADKHERCPENNNAVLENNP